MVTFGRHTFNATTKTPDQSGTHRVHASTTCQTMHVSNLRGFSEIEHQTVRALPPIKILNRRFVLILIDHWDFSTLFNTRYSLRVCFSPSGPTLNNTAIWIPSCFTKNLAQKGEAVRRHNKAREGLRRHTNRNAWYSSLSRVSSA